MTSSGGSFSSPETIASPIPASAANAKTEVDPSNIIGTSSEATYAEQAVDFARPNPVLVLAIPFPEAPAGFKPVSETDALKRIERAGDGYVVSTLNGLLLIESWEQSRKSRSGAELYERTSAGAKGARVPSDRKSARVKLGDIKMNLGPGWGLRVEKGWLSSWAFGEFGGGLLFVADETGEITIVAEDNTILLARMTNGLFAVQGLIDYRNDSGRLVQVLGPQDPGSGTSTTKDGWRIDEITDLHHEPDATTQDGDRFLFAEDRFISTLETNGQQREIYDAEQRLGIRSLTRLPNGDVWAGASAAVLRLHPKSDAAYTAQWFAPLTAKVTRPRE